MIACVKATTTTIGTPSTSTSTSPATTTTLAPTTTTMNYCVEEKGMNQPLTIPYTLVISNPPPTSPTSFSDINPTSTSPGLDFPSNPQINVTLDQPATLTVIYVPSDRPDKPTNVKDFTVEFVYPNGTSSPIYNSTIPSPTATTSTSTSTSTTTPAGGIPLSTTPSPVVPPSDVSPQVNLPANFRVPEDTIMIITIKSTIDGTNPTGVC